MKRIYARNCTVGKLTVEDASEFVGEHHRQGMVGKASNLRAHGLHHEGELVAVALFCNPRTQGMQRRYTTELLRLVFHSGVRITGGASKLIKDFLETDPWDLFTYQGSSGEDTSVYEHAGLTLIKAAAPKDVLVRNGLTREKAKNNWRDWISMEQAAARGPDALLGTTLGEVFKADGTRKSNIELFLSECDYHIETIPGDSVYAWINPEVSFYVYRITSTAGPGYYIGRKAIKKASPSTEDCMDDGYMGSGGAKFKAWVASVGAETLIKTIVSQHDTWEATIAREKKEIADRHISDSECMNFLPGGTGLGRTIILIQEGSCVTHGQTLHNGSSCLRCSAAKSWSTRPCEVHGETFFRGDKCERCSAKNLYSTKLCPVHGEATFRANSCLKCISNEVLSEKVCSIHGAVLHLGSTCATCTSQSAVAMKECVAHGLTKHQGAVCNLCNSQASVSTRDCSIHGFTKFQGDVCMKCNAAGQIFTKTCLVHGEVTHKGDACTVCTAQKAVSMKECFTHGLTKHQGNVCNRCNSQASVSLQQCPVHGETKHQGERCAKCRNASLVGLRECPVHGNVKHQGKSCFSCKGDRRRAKSAAAAAAAQASLGSE